MEVESEGEEEFGDTCVLVDSMSSSSVAWVHLWRELTTYHHPLINPFLCCSLSPSTPLISLSPTHTPQPLSTSEAYPIPLSSLINPFSVQLFATLHYLPCYLTLYVSTKGFCSMFLEICEASTASMASKLDSVPSSRGMLVWRLYLSLVTSIQFD